MLYFWLFLNQSRVEIIKSVYILLLSISPYQKLIMNIQELKLKSSEQLITQAEDGIRDLIVSRGLGDVYKRQLLFQP